MTPINRQTIMKQPQTLTYLSYLLRLWRNDESASWRAALKNPRTGEQRAFASLGQLVAFLEEETGERMVGKNRSAPRRPP